MPPYGGNDCLYAVVRQCRIFSPLQDKSPESQCVSLFAAIQNTFRTQPVTCYVRITFPDAAVIAVVPAAITYFNQSTDINPVSEMPEADLPCLFVNDSQGVRVTSGQQLPEFFGSKSSFLP
jgi:hypothetical protein